jgi:thymidylate synthase ThyX
MEKYPTPKVTLLTHTALPLETVYSVWDASKGTGKLRSPEERAATVPKEEVEKLFRAVIAQRIPIGEHVDMVFMLEHISVSWREQAVRHRIGTKASPERVGADHVMMSELPDLADSSWWSQSMRIQDMGRFASAGEYRLPETIKEHPERERLERAYHGAMTAIEDTYNMLTAAGIPMEDARELMPLGAQHRMSWKLNIGALQHIVGKRGCWVLQEGLWSPVIRGMISECAKKIHPIFSELVTPPCMDPGSDKFKGCVYMEEIRRRYTEDDKLPPCSLHAKHHQFPELKDKAWPEAAELVNIPRKADMLKRAEIYRDFWNRDPFTGALRK